MHWSLYSVTWEHALIYYFICPSQTQPTPTLGRRPICTLTYTHIGPCFHESSQFPQPVDMASLGHIQEQNYCLV